MKAIMYHYVRPDSGGMPYFRYLSLDDFRRQLDHLASTTGFVSKDDFLRSLETGTPQSDGVLLTFDDGLADHAEHVLPELSRRGLWGLFYVSTGHYSTGRMLDVHRVHVLIGRHGGADILRALDELVTGDMLTSKDVAEFRELTYRWQTNDEATLVVKRILNYFISYEWRPIVMDKLMARYFNGGESALVESHYMTPEQIRSLHRAGMAIGSHSVTHPVFSKLEEEEQRAEIADSFAFLESVTGKPEFRTYCHPYGGFHSFNDITERILTEHHNLCAFNVEPRDISTDDLSRRPQALPRYDCNQFPHGSAKLGDN